MNEYDALIVKAEARLENAKYNMANGLKSMAMLEVKDAEQFLDKAKALREGKNSWIKKDENQLIVVGACLIALIFFMFFRIKPT